MSWSPNPEALPELFRTHVERADLFPEDGTLVLAVSGGADSMALMDLMVAWTDRFAGRLVVGHVDHGLRPESGVVAARVRDVASGLDVPVAVAEVRLVAGASETRARTARYRALRDIQDRHRARYLVTAHHADDQTETILQRVVNGSGVAGVAGIPAVGPGGLRRPLLPFRRQALRRYAMYRNLVFEDDPSNTDPTHDRSWLRSVLVPQLVERFGEDVLEGVERFGEAAKANREAWDQLLTVLPLDLREEPSGVSVRRDALAALPVPLREALVAALNRRVGALASRERRLKVMEMLGGHSGRRIELGADWYAEIAFDRLRVVRDTHRGRGVGSIPLALEHGDAKWAGRWQMRWYRGTAPQRIERQSMQTWVSFHTGLRWRKRRPGDTIRPLGGVGRRPLGRLLMEARIPRSERWAHPVLVGPEGPLWVPGVCRSAASLPEPESPALCILAERLEELERS